MTRTDRPRALLIAVTKNPGHPWWWDLIDRDSLPCALEYRPVLLRRGRPRSVLSREFVSLSLQCLSIAWRARRLGYTYLFTVECDWSSFIVAAVQTLLRWRAPRHVIVQFIMRERTGALSSRVKYAVMKWCFSSVHLCVCSSRQECRYYAHAFNWSPEKLAYVPVLTDPAHLELARRPVEPFVLSAGRTFRDYATLSEAFEEPSPRLVVVASLSSLPRTVVWPPHVQVLHDLPPLELGDLIARAMAVVVPLEDRQISVGQSVVLQAMAMGKPVVATRVNGTEDYVEHMRTGMLVPPRDAQALRDAVAVVVTDGDLRRRLGEAAVARVKAVHLPRHYALGISRALSGERLPWDVLDHLGSQAVPHPPQHTTGE